MKYIKGQQSVIKKKLTVITRYNRTKQSLPDIATKEKNTIQ